MQIHKSRVIVNNLIEPNIKENVNSNNYKNCKKYSSKLGNVMERFQVVSQF